MNCRLVETLDRLFGRLLWLRLRTGIPLLLAAFTLTVALLLLASNIQSVERDVEGDALNAMTQRATRLQMTLEFLLRHERLDRIQAVLAAMAVESGHTVTVVIDDADRIVASSRREFLNEAAGRIGPNMARGWDAQAGGDAERARKTLSGTTRLVAKGDAVVAVYPLVLGVGTRDLRPSRIGILFIEYDIAREKVGHRARVVQEVAQFSALLVLLAALLWLFLHFALARRTARLVRTAQQASKGDLGVRTNLAGADELATIGRAFDRMLDRLQHTQARLVESELRLGQALEAAHMLVWFFDVPGEILTYSILDGRDGSERGLEAIAYADFLRGLHPEDRGRFDAALHAAEDGMTRFETEYRISARDGRYRWYALRGNVHDVATDGRPLRLTGVAWDITAAKEAEQQLELYREHLEEMVEARTVALNDAYKELEAFSYSASHDLQAPLRAVSGFSEVLREDFGDKLEPEALDYLDRIVGAIRRMSQLIDDLLALSRTSRAELRREEVDLSAMVREQLEELHAAEPLRAAEFFVAPGLQARGDANLLRVLLANLLGNAWKYSRTRDKTVIEFGAKITDGRTAWFVRDNGVGFDMARAEKLFEPFHRLHGREEFEGTGIGLATVDRIIRRHGGTIRAESISGKGATFFFTLGEQSARQAAVLGQGGERA